MSPMATTRATPWKTSWGAVVVVAGAVLDAESAPTGPLSTPISRSPRAPPRRRDPPGKRRDRGKDSAFIRSAYHRCASAEYRRSSARPARRRGLAAWAAVCSYGELMALVARAQRRSHGWRDWRGWEFPVAGRRGDRTVAAEAGAP